MSEPEFTAADGTVRKAHYGEGKQPWDHIVEAGWGPAFAAGNVLKYVRRAAAKNGEDDLAKARWYCAELMKLSGVSEANSYVVERLLQLLTTEEINLVGLDLD